MAEFVDYYGTGRRKTSVARVHLRPGTGKIKVNGEDFDNFVDYFNGNKVWAQHAHEPILTAQSEDKFDFVIRVHGGGYNGQAGAVRLGIARALLEYDPELRSELKKEGMLTRDPRKVERKKYGLRKARKHAQFSKR